MQASKPQPTPTVQQILAHAQSARLADETFVLSMDAMLGPVPFTVTGTGRATTQPERIAVTISVTLGDTTTVSDNVFDVATNDVYMKITAPANLATPRYEKNPDAALLITATDLQVFPPYAKLTHATLLGSERVNGVAVWHIQGTFVEDHSSKTTDIYVRQSDYLPVRQHLHATGDLTSDLTCDYTAVNTGISIDIPSTG